MEARLLQDKLEDAINLVRSFARRKKVTLRELQSLIGMLNFACKIILPGRPFLRRLIDLAIGISRPNFHIRLNNEARLDLATWLIFLECFNRVLVLLNKNWLSSEKLELFTASSFCWCIEGEMVLRAVFLGADACCNKGIVSYYSSLRDWLSGRV